MAERRSAPRWGGTIDVLGCRIYVVYPKENRKIFEEMTGGGERSSPSFQWGGSQVRKIPIRNRIISGMALELFPWKARSDSGSLTGRIS